MSFILDPPLLLLSGLAIFFLGKRMEWSRHAKVVVGLAVALIFIIFSMLLYVDLIRCAFPFFSHMKGSEFMFHSDITHITKSMVPKIFVMFLFISIRSGSLPGMPSYCSWKREGAFPKRSTHTLMSRARMEPTRKASSILKTIAFSMNLERLQVSMVR